MADPTGSIPLWLKSFPEQSRELCSRDVIVEWFGLRLGCVWLRRHVVIETIDRRAIGAGDQVAVRVDGDLNAAETGVELRSVTTWDT